jgi:hypothetical protein
MKTLNEQELNMVSGGEISDGDMWIGGLCVATFAIGVLVAAPLAAFGAVVMGVVGLAGDAIAIEAALD